MRYSLKIALSSLLGALVIAISVSFQGIPYPIAPFLMIDFSEIIDLLALFLGGWWVGIVVATIHFLGLMVNAGRLIGPLMKYIAVLSMYAGIYICKKMAMNTNKSQYSAKVYNVVTIVSSSIIRALVMIFVNIVVLLFVAPEFYIFFEKQLSALTGIEPSVVDVFLYVGYIIGSYNIIQTIFALVPVYILLNIVRRHIHIEKSL